MKKTIAVVVPCYNEELGLSKLIEELSTVKKRLSKNYDIDTILINDGSSDDTQQVIEDLAKRDNHIFYRTFARNAGHQAALRAGITAAATYDAVIMLDADMQHPPKLIHDMIAAWEKGYQIIQMVRDDSAQEVGAFKYFTSKLYYKILNYLSSLSMEYGASDFRLIDQTVANMVAQSPERDLFLRGYFSWLPVKRTVIPYKPEKRFAGSSKYTFKKMLKLATNGVLQFSEKPLRIAMNIGVIMAVLSFLYGLFIIISRLAGRSTVSGWTSLMVVLLFCFGINFILLGIIGRYLAHSISLQKQRPEYVVAAEKLRKDIG